MRRADPHQCISAANTPCKVIQQWQAFQKESAMGKRTSEAINSGDSCRGRSIVEMMCDELDVIVDRLMNGGEAADGRDPGRAEGVAFCIAIIQQPYNPSIDVVREEAMLRYEQKVEGD